MQLGPVRQITASDAVFEQLRRQVLNGQAAPGSRLPAERVLTEAMQVNRQAVREALQRLVQAGLVRTQHGGGTRVLDYRKAAGLDLLPALLMRPDESVDPRVVRSIFEMRACIGPDVARCCAERAAPSLAVRLRSRAAAVETAPTLAEKARFDLDFWDELVDGSENIAYRLTFNSLRRTYEPVIDVVARVLAAELEAPGLRSEIAAAIERRDANRAARAAARLLSLGSEQVDRFLESLPEGETL